jgi:hypothetical protein
MKEVMALQANAQAQHLQRQNAKSRITEPVVYRASGGW